MQLQSIAYMFLMLQLSPHEKLVASLQCYECVGSVSSDCARGVNAAAVAVNCTARIILMQDSQPTKTMSTRTEGKFAPYPTQKPFIPYPACVTYTKVPYNGRDNTALVHRKCLISAENFCKDRLSRRTFSKCQQCNNTDFCL